MIRLSVKLVSLGLVLGWVSLVAPSWAGYKPPRNATRPVQVSTTTGTRTGCSARTGALTAIAPQQHVGQTTSVYPTFVWFMPDEKPYLMEFELYEVVAPRRTKLVMRQSLQSQFGLMQLTLPKDKGPLVAGKQYVWQAIAYCNKNRPSSALVAKAELVVQTPATGLAAGLTTTLDPLTRVERYAEAGFWYDAMREAMLVQGPKGKAVRESLLRDLISLEVTWLQTYLNQVVALLK